MLKGPNHIIKLVEFDYGIFFYELLGEYSTPIHNFFVVVGKIHI